MPSEPGGQLSDDDRDHLVRAHVRLRKASQAIEGLTATKPTRGRWVPQPPPPEVLDAALTELDEAYRDLWQVQRDVLGLAPPPGWSPPEGRPGPSPEW